MCIRDRWNALCLALQEHLTPPCFRAKTLHSNFDISLRWTEDLIIRTLYVYGHIHYMYMWMPISFFFPADCLLRNPQTSNVVSFCTFVIKRLHLHRNSILAHPAYVFLTSSFLNPLKTYTRARPSQNIIGSRQVVPIWLCCLAVCLISSPIFRTRCV